MFRAPSEQAYIPIEKIITDIIRTSKQSGNRYQPATHGDLCLKRESWVTDNQMAFWLSIFFLSAESQFLIVNNADNVD